MSQNEQPIEWFLARDGQRHGPISEVELRKFIDKPGEFSVTEGGRCVVGGHDCSSGCPVKGFLRA